MALTVRPDPRRPSGGYAELSAASDALPETEATVSVFDAFSERFLGIDGWQSDRAEFGPYPVVQDGGRATLVIGPEIVNQIEEYAALKIRVNRVEADISWPDDVVPMPGAPRMGGLAVTRAAPARGPGALTGRAPGTEAPPPKATDAPEAGTASDAPKGRSRLPLIAGLSALALLIAGGALAWFLMQPPAPVFTETRKTEPPPPPPPDPCGAEALAGLAGLPFAEGRALMASCGARVTPQQALAALEAGADAGDAEALLLFGEIYDAGANDDPVETEIGLSLTPSASKAAEYYARARAAGSAEAVDRLGRLCPELRAASDTLSRSAALEYCSP
ncbi:hypothetical protein BV509_13375 [Rhodovulum sulfidophilum]|uniref:Sel1 repeat-containing protein n=1 Tax=Rhodovulum visakhapatnamense TaxID=364297 RepID=A0ABS1RJH2_9RHOB|nr:hypothetical protein [Rhodovulum visakhapatnamense]MBL3569623.1 hypothetical protein [Rhodovulum visakhapatnamense]MBL3579798.1 hypothetical protein [Rhodovulum visakhapatnamense]OLS45233.1 hypothetical protein BV509_13375 [Rhodovulum sulfidophilum]